MRRHDAVASGRSPSRGAENYGGAASRRSRQRSAPRARSRRPRAPARPRPGSRRGTRRRSAIARRTSSRFSPTPPEKTSASRPPSAAAIAATACAMRYVKTAKPSGVVEPAERGEPGLVLERVVELVGRQAALAQEVEERARVDRARAGGHRHALERAEAHRRVDRAAVEHGRDRAAAAEVADDEPRHRAPAPRPTATESRGSRSGGCPTPRASAAGPRTSPPRRDASRGRPCRRRRRAGRPAARAARALDRRSAGALWSGASVESLVDRAPRRRRRSTTGSTERAAAVDDAVPDRVDVGGSRVERATGSARSSSSTTRELEARRAGVDDEDARLRRPGPVADRPGRPRRARASRRAPRAGGRPSPGAGARRCAARPGHAVDHVHDEVEAVEVVEHDHVERRRRRPLLLVAAHVQVRVVRAPVGEAVDQPRVAVVGEDDRPVGREERVELARRRARAGARSRAAGASGRRR